MFTSGYKGGAHLSTRADDDSIADGDHLKYSWF